MMSEAKQRKRSKSLLPFDIVAETAAFSFPKKQGGLELKSAAYCQVPNVTNLVEWLLDSNDR